MLHLEIITPERIAYSEDVDMVIVPGADGRLGILPNHMPLFAQLTDGELKIKKQGEEYYLAIGGGFVEVTREKVIVLVTRAKHADELNEEQIMHAKQEAEAALKRPVSPEERLTIQVALRRSLLDLAILQKRRRGVH